MEDDFDKQNEKLYNKLFRIKTCNTSIDFRPKLILTFNKNFDKIAFNYDEYICMILKQNDFSKSAEKGILYFKLNYIKIISKEK